MSSVKSTPVVKMLSNLMSFYEANPKFKTIYLNGDVETKKKLNMNMKKCPIYLAWRVKREAEVKAFLEDEAKKPENIARRKKELADIGRMKGHW